MEPLRLVRIGQAKSVFKPEEVAAAFLGELDGFLNLIVNAVLKRLFDFIHGAFIQAFFPAQIQDFGPALQAHVKY